MSDTQTLDPDNPTVGQRNNTYLARQCLTDALDAALTYIKAAR